MNIPGHLAVALAQHCLPPLAKDKRALKPLLLASLFPDIVDKIIGYILKMMPNGRHFAHNIFSLTGTSLLVGFIWGKMSGLAWFLGYGGHLVVDSKTFVPWFFPFRRYSFRKGRFAIPLPRFFKELLFLGFVLIIHRLCR